MNTIPDIDAIEDTRALALEMFEGNVPCVLAMGNPECPKRAQWLAHFQHMEATDCAEPPPFPLCDDHKLMIERAAQPFWQMWLSTAPPPCEACGRAMALDRFEAIS